MLLAAGAAACAHATEPLKPEDVTPQRAEASLRAGLHFLLESQNADGSWGGAWDSLTTWSGWTWNNPESHRSWRVATTGLCVLALLDAGQDEAELAAADRAVTYLVANADVRRPSEWDTMDCWAHIYGMQGLAAAYAHPRYSDPTSREDIQRAIEAQLKGLARSEALCGGWGYLEFAAPRTAHPQWATSFTTAAGIVALLDARQEGVAIDEGVLGRAVKAVRRCYLPNGAYTYSVRTVPNPRKIGSINRVNGSLCRIQCCNLALLMAGDEISEERLRWGLEVFFREHRFLDIARLKPVPHESYYQNSGYFYLFGHYYAARVIEQLPPEDRLRFWPMLQYEVMKIQGDDGAMWDYDHHAYDKPYGTAYSVLVLAHSLRDENKLQGPVTSTPTAPPP
jgi:hypothetical protein